MGSGVKVGELWALLRLERGGFDSAVRGAGTGLTGLNSKIDATVRKTGLLNQVWKGIGVGVGISAFGGLERVISGAVRGIASMVDKARDLYETINKSQVVFGKDAKAIQAWGKTASTSIGLSENAAISAAATFGNLFVSLGQAPEKVAPMSKALVQLGADLASFNNISIDEALQKLQSGIVGQARPLRELGVAIDETAVDVEAARLGFQKLNGVFTQGQKVQARYSLIFKQTGTAQGDFARTADGLANTQRTLSAQWDDIQAQIGDALLPAMMQLAIVARDQLLPALKEGIPVLIQISGVLIDIAHNAIPILAVAFSVKLVAAFNAARAAGVEGAAAVKLAWGAAALGIPILMTGLEDLAKQNPPPPTWWSDMTNAEKVAWAEMQRINDVESRRWTGNTRSFIDAQVNEFGRLKLEIPQVLQDAGDAANAVLRSTSSMFSATLQDGTTIFSDSAEQLAAELPGAVKAAKLAAEHEASLVPKGLADALLGQKGDLAAIRQAIIDAIAGAVTDARSITESEGILAGRDLGKGFRKGSTELDAILLEQVDKVVTNLQILAPLALSTGAGIPKNLKAGIDANLSATMEALDHIRLQAGSHLDLADFAEAMGYAGIAAYIRGLKTPNAPATATAIARGLQNAMKLDLFDEGRHASQTYLAGFSSTAYTAATGWLNGLKQMLVGNSPPPEGPLKDLDLGAERAARSWTDVFARTLGGLNLGPALAGAIPGTGGPALGAPGAGGMLPALGLSHGAASPGTQIRIDHLDIHGVGSDVSPAAARRFGRSVVDELTAAIRDQRGQTVRVRAGAS